jgi:sugar phosphate isomerase/epimerase
VDEASGFFRDERVAVSAVHVPYKAHSAPSGRKRRLTPASGDPEVIKPLILYSGAGVRAARAFGAPLVVIHCGSYGDRMEGGTVSNFVSFFARLAPLLGGGVKAALENVATPVSDPEYVSFLLGRLSFEDFGVCYDVAHAHIGRTGGTAGGCGGRPLHVHVSDNDGKRDQHKIPMEGGIDWRVAMKSLRDAGYDGCINFEPRGAEPPETLLRKCREAYGRLAAL